jgi:hypothetical protein
MHHGRPDTPNISGGATEEEGKHDSRKKPSPMPDDGGAVHIQETLERCMRDIGWNAPPPPLIPINLSQFSASSLACIPIVTCNHHQHNQRTHTRPSAAAPFALSPHTPSREREGSGPGVGGGVWVGGQAQTGEVRKTQDEPLAALQVRNAPRFCTFALLSFLSSRALLAAAARVPRQRRRDDTTTA